MGVAIRAILGTMLEMRTGWMPIVVLTTLCLHCEALAGSGRSATEGNEAAILATEKAKATEGDPVAQFKLGHRYLEGPGVERDSTTAAHWFEKSAAQEYGPALMGLGNLYFMGVGVPRDREKALELIERAAKLDNAKAQGIVGALYATGKGLYATGRKFPQDTAKALGLLRPAETAGDSFAREQLAALYREGRAAPRDDAEAQRVVGTSLDEWNQRLAPTAARDARQRSWGWRPDGPGAERYHDARRSTEAGSSREKAMLAEYYAGRGEFEEAAKWYRSIAIEDREDAWRWDLPALIAAGVVEPTGDAECQAIVGAACDVFDTQADRERAALTLARAHERRHDGHSAARWYRRAASAGSVEARSWLQYLLLLGYDRPEGEAECQALFAATCGQAALLVPEMSALEEEFASLKGQCNYLADIPEVPILSGPNLDECEKYDTPHARSVCRRSTSARWSSEQIARGAPPSRKADSHGELEDCICAKIVPWGTQIVNDEERGSLIREVLGWRIDLFKRVEGCLG